MRSHLSISKSAQRESIKGSLWRFNACHQFKSNTQNTVNKPGDILLDALSLYLLQVTPMLCDISINS